MIIRSEKGVWLNKYIHWKNSVGWDSHIDHQLSTNFPREYLKGRFFAYWADRKNRQFNDAFCEHIIISKSKHTIFYGVRLHYGRVFISFLHLHRILQRKKILSYSLSLTSAEVLCIEVIKTHEISISLFRHPIYLFPFSLYLGAFAFSACFTIDIRFLLGDHLILLECLTPFSDFYIHVRATRINNSIRSIVRVHFDSTFSTLLYLVLWQ